MICQFCNTQFGCSCNSRTASDGTQHCVSCIGTYEASLINKRDTASFQGATGQFGATPPVIVSVEYKPNYN